MKVICPPTSQAREQALELFASICSSIPFDDGQLSEARANVVKEGGKELLVEASAVVGAFEAITKLVDATGRQLMSKPKTRIKVLVMKTLKNRNVIGAGVTAVAFAFIAAVVIKR